MAVPDREVRARQLAQMLGLKEEVIAWDTDHEGHIVNWWRAVERASADNPSHVLILEDDAEPCVDFIEAVKKVIVAYPDRIISFFSAKHRAGISRQITLTEHYGLSDVAVVYPRKWLDELRDDYNLRIDELRENSRGADGLRMKLRPLQKTWSTLPSLVQHGLPHESTLGHNFANSTARSFIGSHTSALMLDWSQL